MSTSTSLPPLLEREPELRAIERLLVRATDRTGGLLLVEGAAGVGKTRLCQAAIERAADDLEVEVFQARGGELEAELSFGVVRELLEAVMAAKTRGEREWLLEGAATRAAPIVDPPVPRPDASPESSPAALHGLYWLCSNLAERRPLLLVLDDAHWADAASLRFIAYLARRLEGLAMAVMVAARPSEPAPAVHLLSAVRAAPILEIASPGPFSEAATGELVRAGFGVEPSEPFVRACYRASGGNPLYLRAIVVAALDADLSPDESSAAQRSARSRFGHA